MDNIFLLGAAAVIFIMLIISIVLGISNSSKINSLLEYSDEGDLLSAIKEYYDKVDDLSKTINNTSDAVMLSRLAGCENEAASSIKKIGTINFDAYDDVTGKLSFALTLLNDFNDGVILTSLYGHNSCNTYIRQIVNGESSTKLIDEEKLSLERAKNGKKVKKNDI